GYDSLGVALRHNRSVPGSILYSKTPFSYTKMGFLFCLKSYFWVRDLGAIFDRTLLLDTKPRPVVGYKPIS
ncbi:hypothetical protein, partial [Anabaena subtropica]